MTKDRNIVLIGMMGSGKTTIGSILAELLGYSFIDTDREVENLTKRPISEIFATGGEAEFRRIETEVVLKAATNLRQVIATGGGVVLKAENANALCHTGFLVFLYASPEVLSLRLKDDSTRPLLAGDDLCKRIKDLLHIRLPLYRKIANMEINTDNQTAEQIADILVQALQIAGI